MYGSKTGGAIMRIWFHLYDGNLTDAPGRCESWTEEFCFASKNKWLLRTKSTSFSGWEETETYIEQKTSKSLVDWLSELDSLDQESQERTPFYDANSFYDPCSFELLGPRLKRLKLISGILNQTYVFNYICKIEKNRYFELEQYDWFFEDIQVEELGPLTKEDLPIAQNKLYELNMSIDKLITAHIFDLHTKKSTFDEHYLKRNIPINFIDGEGAYSEWRKKNDQYEDNLREYIQHYVIKHKQLPTGVRTVPSNGLGPKITSLDFDWLHELCKMEALSEESKITKSN